MLAERVPPLSTQDGPAKFAEEVTELLEAFDLTRSHWTAAQLADGSHNTVAHYVTAREAGGLSAWQVHPHSCSTPTWSRSRPVSLLSPKTSSSCPRPADRSPLPARDLTGAGYFAGLGWRPCRFTPPGTQRPP